MLKEKNARGIKKMLQYKGKQIYNMLELWGEVKAVLRVNL